MANQTAKNHTRTSVWTKQEKQDVDEFNRRRAETRIDGMTIDEWLATRRAEGLKIDPETAEVDWIYAQTLDPYGVYPQLPDRLQQVGREYFAHAPGSDVWVLFDDLPQTTAEALWEKYMHSLAFPAGLEEPLS
jgi:hypothetical protein